jgi:hypothetical protein
VRRQAAAAAMAAAAATVPTSGGTLTTINSPATALSSSLSNGVSGVSTALL